MPTRRYPKRVYTLLTYVAGNVRALRLGAGLTQEILARCAAIDLRFLQKIEAATTNVSVAALLSIADVLGEPVERLLRPAPMPMRRRGRPPK